MKKVSILLLVVLLFNCKNEVKKTKVKFLTANHIVDKSIAVSGGEVFGASTVNIEFDFRNIHYKSTYAKSTKILNRLMLKENDTILDTLNGEQFQRYINEKPVFVEDSMAVKYSASVNSVHYFSVLPYGLNDKAVTKTYLEQVTIKEQLYHKIEVTFSEEGGGSDFDDVFVYWINSESYSVDYLAYEFHVNGGGLRFREAYNERIINGIRFVDYKNYKPSVDKAKVHNLDKLFESSNLKLLSKIELEDVRVETCVNC